MGAAGADGAGGGHRHGGDAGVSVRGADIAGAVPPAGTVRRRGHAGAHYGVRQRGGLPRYRLPGRGTGDGDGGEDVHRGGTGDRIRHGSQRGVRAGVVSAGVKEKRTAVG